MLNRVLTAFLITTCLVKITFAQGKRTHTPPPADHPPIQFSSPGAFCAAMDAVFRGVAQKSESRRGKMLAMDVAYFVTTFSVTDVIRNSVDHPIGDTADVELWVGKHDMGSYWLEYRAREGRPFDAGHEYLIFGKWDKYREAFIPFGAGGGIYELGERTSTARSETLPQRMAAMHPETLVNALKSDQSCSR